MVAVYDLSSTYLSRIKGIKSIAGEFGGGRKAHCSGRRRLGARAIFVADSKKMTDEKMDDGRDDRVRDGGKRADV